MTDHILLEVVTPECRILSTRVSEVQFRTATRGYYGILPGHTPTLTPLGDGLLYYTQGGEKRWLTVFGGFAEVGPEHVTVLARVSEPVDKLDPAKVKSETQQAEKRLRDAETPENLERARTELDACLIRMQALGHTDHQQ